ncbi:MAG: tRNA (adenosine(37)-N6)-threonylcarbamoyltransferase complex ATPase subunit type 1 TsaE [Gammaproteobacteria bacterium]|nr:tRNA (adenosine(37)-N6)-threonylcarbamoyltransferase complex ATPase subunit type 1 TsaE [Gammaproteobacteria bacterium]
MRLTTHSAEETEEFGRELAIAHPDLQDDPVVLCLAGDLGAGKTTFARGFLHGLGVTEPVRSPTYTLLELHELEEVTALHIDLYRLHDEEEFESLGLRDWAIPNSVWLIEWPERAGNRLPPVDLILTFSVRVPVHDIEVGAVTGLGEEWLSRLKRAPVEKAPPPP